MSSANPPYPWFSGIQYNPSFFASSLTGDLTKAQANALYLRKTVPDTATAAETFQGGIYTDNIEHYTGTLTMKGINMIIGDGGLTSSINTLATTYNLNTTNPNPNSINIGSISSTTTIDNSCADYYITSNNINANTNTIELNSLNGSSNNINIGNVTSTTQFDIKAQNLYLQGENSVSIYSGVTPSATVTISGVGTAIGDADTDTLSLTSKTYTNNTDTFTQESYISNSTETPILNLNTTNLLGGTNVVNIGHTTATTAIKINRPLTIGYSPVFTTATQIGYTISTTTANTGIATQTVWNPQFLIFNGLTLGSGVWLINYSCRLATSGVSLLSQYSMWVNGTTGQDAQYGQSMNANSIQCGSGNGNLFGNGSTVQTYTGASNAVNIAFFGTGTLTGTLSLKAGNNILTATRLA